MTPTFVVRVAVVLSSLTGGGGSRVLVCCVGVLLELEDVLLHGVLFGLQCVQARFGGSCNVV